jgi:hypothetical protein
MMRSRLTGAPVWASLLGAVFLTVGCKTQGSSDGARAVDASDGKASTGNPDARMEDVADGPVGTLGADGSADRSAGDTAPTGDTGPVDPKVDPEANRVCRAAITAMSQRAKKCLGYDVDDAPHLDACPDYYFNADSNRSVTEVAACIQDLANRPCSDLDLNITPSCLRPGKRPAGAGCLFPSQCESNFCWSALDACATCRDGNFLPGAKCERGQCRPGDFCDEAAAKCVDGGTLVRVGEGEPCLGSSKSSTGVVVCQGDFHCANDGVYAALACRTQQWLDCGSVECDADSYCWNAGECHPYAKLGEACSLPGSFDYPRCVPTTRCWKGKCTNRRLLGETCDDRQPCSEFYECAGGVCRLRSCPA